mmetsp:Transcript_16189/g.47235  ORF Transcript_16189/g.47235 Transcript_16189/m.47235 type:complete len:329 (+) Transcript_16189:64-1050(+)
MRCKWLCALTCFLISHWTANGLYAATLSWPVPRDRRTKRKGKVKVKKQNLTYQSLAWLHVPSTGTSFANTLVTWACPGLPDTAVVQRAGDNSFVDDFMKKYQPLCQPGFKLCAKHPPLGKRCNKVMDHRYSFVTMLRDPEQRLISSWYHHKRNCQDSIRGCLPNLETYVQTVKNCGTRLIVGKHCFGGEKEHYKKGDNVTALRRLHEEFAFVGLTEEWDLSVCLFHAMFGGSCHRREFLNVRPGEYHKPGQLYDTRGIGDWQDRRLYKAGTEIFWKSVAKYNVSRARCVDICKNYSMPFLEQPAAAPAEPAPVVTELRWRGRWRFRED